MFTINYDNKLIEQVGYIARIAGFEIMKIYNGYSNTKLDLHLKMDSSPLTSADLLSNQIIICLLQKLIPNIPIISEEYLPDWQICNRWDHFWLIDPLDGTKEFLSRNGEFTVNIALIRYGEPVIGVIYVPERDILYTANGKQAWKTNANGETLKIAVKTSYNPIIVMSRNHMIFDQQKLYDYLMNIKHYTIVHIGSSLKFCLIAEGSAQFYPRFSVTKVWDTAAGHIIATSAGALVNDWDGYPLNYKHLHPSFMNPGFHVSLY